MFIVIFKFIFWVGIIFMIFDAIGNIARKS